MGQRRIALLRGINVGGHRRVPMAELRALLTDDVGLSDVATYIQSGNVVFTGDGPEREVEARISGAVAKCFGFEVPVVVRSVDVLPGLLERSASIHPIVDADTHDKRVNVGFLTAMPSDDALAALDPDRSPGDSIVVEGDHAFVAYRTGQSATKLTGDYIERVLDVAMTMRNLATVRTLSDMA